MPSGDAQSQVTVDAASNSALKANLHECAWHVTFSPTHKLGELCSQDKIVINTTLIDQCLDGKIVNPFADVSHFIVLDSHGVINRKAFHSVRKELGAALNYHMCRKGQVIIRTHGKHDSLNYFKKWK